MKSIRSYLLLAIGTWLFAGCDEHVSVGGSKYVLVTPDALPDGHPGTALRYKDKQVWPSLHSGYFHNSPADFYRDGVFVFVGSVPSSHVRDYDAQLFAIREAGPAVLLSQRAFHLPLTNSYFVEHVTPVPDGFRVEIRFWEPSKNNVTVTNRISWADIADWVKEAESVPLIQVTPSEKFRLLP
jgi:hypothetical protein